MKSEGAGSDCRTATPSALNLCLDIPRANVLSTVPDKSLQQEFPRQKVEVITGGVAGSHNQNTAQSI